MLALRLVLCKNLSVSFFILLSVQTPAVGPFCRSSSRTSHLLTYDVRKYISVRKIPTTEINAGAATKFESAIDQRGRYRRRH